MAYSKQDLVEKLNAEVVGGQYVAGPIGGRVFVGKINEEGVFFITPEGEKMLREYDTPSEEVEPEVVVKPKRTKKVAAEPVVEPAAE